MFHTFVFIRTINFRKEDCPSNRMAKTTRLNLPFALESQYIKLDSGAQRILDRYNILDLFWNYFPYHIIIIIRINNPIEILKIQSKEIRDRSGQIFWFLIFLWLNKGLLNFPYLGASNDCLCPVSSISLGLGLNFGRFWPKSIPKSNVFYYRIIMFCIYPFFKVMKGDR